MLCSNVCTYSISSFTGTGHCELSHAVKIIGKLFAPFTKLEQPDLSLIMLTLFMV